MLFTGKIKISFPKWAFFNGTDRSSAMKKNIVSSFILKGVELATGFLRVTFILSFVSKSDYGIWLTVSSFVAWFTFLDLGLSSGLLNKLTEALSKKDYNSARIYISTAYYGLFIIMAIFYLIFLLIYPFVNWHSVITPHEPANSYLEILVLLSFTSFALQMVVNIIATVLKADQKYAFGQTIGLSGSVVYLILLIICGGLFKGNLLILALIAYAPPILSYILFSFILFRKRYSQVRPSFKYADSTYFKDIARLGIKFFVIQVAAIVMFTTDNIIIAQISNVEEVVPYNISRYYFGLVSMAYGIVMAPLWPAFTDAFVKNDFEWIKRITMKIIYLWLGLIAAVFVMFLLADTFYNFWVGNKIYVPSILSLMMGLSVIITSWNQPFVFFINSIGRIKLQLYNSILVMIINVPLCLLFAVTFKMGTAGVITATCFCLLIGSVWVPIQYRKIINKTASGIWAE